MPKIPQTRSTNLLTDSSNRLESTYTDYTSASKDWYQKSTVVGHNILNNIFANTQLRRLRFWTDHPKHRRMLKGNLHPEEYKLPDHHLAALIIRKSTFLLDIITPLTHTNNNKKD